MNNITEIALHLKNHLGGVLNCDKHNGVTFTLLTKDNILIRISDHFLKQNKAVKIDCTLSKDTDVASRVSKILTEYLLLRKK